jgi:hypothetical protein
MSVWSHRRMTTRRSGNTFDEPLARLQMKREWFTTPFSFSWGDHAMPRAVECRKT